MAVTLICLEGLKNGVSQVVWVTLLPSAGVVVHRIYALCDTSIISVALLGPRLQQLMPVTRNVSPLYSFVSFRVES